MTFDGAPEPEAKSDPKRAAQNIAEAHRLLTRLREKLDTHPELELAIEKLEMALSALTLKSGAML